MAIKEMKNLRVMVVDDTELNITILVDTLGDDYEVGVAMDGPSALKDIFENPPDIVLLDIMMPGMDGYEVCKRLKECEATKGIPIIFLTSLTNEDDEEKGLNLGAVDYISKPFSPNLIKSRVRNQLELKRYKDHLEDLVSQQVRQLREGYVDTVHRLTLASEYKDRETGSHIKRISYYTKVLAQQMGMDIDFCNNIFYASPMHDIGKVGIPDSILLKDGPLSDEEWKVMITHPFIGSKILEGSASPYLKMAVDIALCHHERWDGSGYPRGLKGEEIPLSARIMSIVDQYDALRSRRPYKDGFDQEKTLSIITNGDGRTTPSHFDPEVLEVFKKSAHMFAEIFEGGQ